MVAAKGAAIALLSALSAMACARHATAVARRHARCMLAVLLFLASASFVGVVGSWLLCSHRAPDSLARLRHAACTFLPTTLHSLRSRIWRTRTERTTQKGDSAV